MIALKSVRDIGLTMIFNCLLSGKLFEGLFFLQCITSKVSDDHISIASCIELPAYA